MNKRGKSAAKRAPRKAPGPHYEGPLPLAAALSALALVKSDRPFTRDGPRADVEYRDLGVAKATGGRVGAKHIRAIKPFPAATGWHWHDMTGHVVFVLKGWIKFRYAGHAKDVIVRAGDCLSQPAGVAHNVIGRSDEMEVLEINLPAEFGTFDLKREPAR